MRRWHVFGNVVTSVASVATGLTTALMTTYAGAVTASAATNLWSDPATWGGTVPAATDAVVIAAGHSVILDTAAVCLSLDIQGTLTAVQTASVSLTTGHINIGAAGSLIIGTEASPYPAAYTATITLNGAEQNRVSRSVTWSGSTQTLGFSNDGVGRSLQVQAGGTLSLIGVAPNYKRTKLNANAAAGTNTFTLMDSVDWLAGDDIVMGTTDFYGISVPEKLTLATAASGTTIQTTATIASARWGALQYVTDSGMSLTAGTLTGAPSGAATVLDERAFLINLRRNIIVQGANDTAWTSNQFGAHCMFMSGGATAAAAVFPNVKLNGVRFNRMGQAGAIGRYPIHWHMCSYNMSNGSTAVSPDGVFIGNVPNNYAKNCAFDSSGQRMITLHGTHGVTLDSNVGWNITGHALFLEEGSEQDNIITNNVVMKVRAPTAANKLINSDVAPNAYGTELTFATGLEGTSGIWFTNPQNTLTGNWVNDCQGVGEWHAFSTQCFGLSINVALVPNTTAITAIADNWSCGNGSVGIQTKRQVIDDFGTITDYTAYLSNFLSTPVTGLHAYKNLAGGYSNRIAIGAYKGFVMADNAWLDVFGQAAVPSLASEILTVAESLNNANSLRVSSKRSAFASYHESLAFQNILAVGYQYISPTQSSADAVDTGGGLMRLDDLYLQPVQSFFFTKNIVQINGSATMRTKAPNIDGHSLSYTNGQTWYRAYTFAGAIRDVNGIFVPAGKHWIYNDPFFTSGLSDAVNVYSGTDAAGSNGVHTSTRYFGLGNATNEYLNINFSTAPNYYAMGVTLPTTFTRQDTSGATLGQWVIGNGSPSYAPLLGWMRHAAIANGGRFTLKFKDTLAGSQDTTDYLGKVYVMFEVNYMDSASDSFLLGVEWSGTVTTTKVFCKAAQFDSWNTTTGAPQPPSASPISMGIARILTSTSSMANVVADTSGTLFWQDTTNNMVWFNVKCGTLATTQYPIGSEAMDTTRSVYRPVVYAVTA